MPTVEKNIVRQAVLFDDSERLRPIREFLYESSAQVLFDFVAKPSIMISSLIYWTSALAAQQNKMMMADESEATVLGEVDRVPGLESQLWLTHSHF